MSSAAAVSSRAAAGRCLVADQGLQAVLVVHRVPLVHLEGPTAGLLGHSVVHQALPVDLHASDQPAV